MTWTLQRLLTRQNATYSFTGGTTFDRPTATIFNGSRDRRALPKEGDHRRLKLPPEGEQRSSNWGLYTAGPAQDLGGSRFNQ